MLMAIDAQFISMLNAKRLVLAMALKYTVAGDLPLLH